MAKKQLSIKVDEDLWQRVVDKFGITKPTDVVTKALEKAVALKEESDGTSTDGMTAYMQVDAVDEDEKPDENGYYADGDLDYDPRNWGKNNPYKITKIGGFDI